MGTAISTPPKPEALKSRLEFGNREQIEALREWDRQVEETHDRARKIEEGEFRKFKVFIDVSGSTEVEVWAVDTAHAREIAMEEMNLDRADLDIEIDQVREAGG